MTKFKRRIALATAIAGLGIVGLGDPAHAASCEEGRKVTLSGTVDNPEFDKAGKLSFDVANPTPCEVDSVVVDLAQPPINCSAGSKFVATGEIVDFIYTLLHADSIRCE